MNMIVDAIAARGDALAHGSRTLRHYHAVVKVPEPQPIATPKGGYVFFKKQFEAGKKSQEEGKELLLRTQVLEGLLK